MYVVSRGGSGPDVKLWVRRDGGGTANLALLSRTPNTFLVPVISAGSDAHVAFGYLLQQAMNIFLVHLKKLVSLAPRFPLYTFVMTVL
jgi:hypothetical protein